MTEAHQDEANGDLARRIEELEAENQSLQRKVKFGLVWEDRPEEVEQQMADRLPVLSRKVSLDVAGAEPQGRPHILIEGDNLHALTVLQATHKGAVDVIYIDPPYNTGNEFVYNDRLVGADDRWRHSAWLSFMDKRLRLAHSLLKDSGVLFISIDDNEQAHLRLLCDQIFGESNFLFMASWQSFDTTKNNAKLVSKNCEYVLVYGKDTSLTSFRGLAKGDKQRATYKNPDEDPRGDYLLTPLHLVASPDNPDRRRSRTFSNGQAWAPPPGRAWAYSEQALDQMQREGRLLLDLRGVKVPQKKSYWSEGNARMPLHTFWRYEEFGSTRQSNAEIGHVLGKGKFSFPKPTLLVKRILDAVGGDSALVLDFFAGSGTTLHAVAQLNAEDGGSRQCILVTNNENDICRKVTQPRVKAVLTGKWVDGKPHDPLPGTLRYYTTGFLPNRRNRDQRLLDLAKASADILAVKESAHDLVADEGPLRVLRGEGVTVAVVTDAYTDHSEFVTMSNQHQAEGGRRVAYLFTWSDSGVEPEIAEQWGGWDVKPLPAPLLAAIRQGITTAGSTR